MEKKVYYYHDLKNDDFANTDITPITIGDDYKYINKKPLYHFGEIMSRAIAIPLIYFILRKEFKFKIKNRKVLKEVRHQGYYLFGNHTNALLDVFMPSLIATPRFAHVIANPEAVSIKGLGWVVKELGAIPTPSTRKAMRNYRNAIDYYIKKRHIIAIYPEAHIWPYYTDIRPFGTESFHYAVESNTPCITLTNIYVERKHKRKPRVVTYLDGPFYPDTSLERSEQIKKLRDDVYNAMKNRVDSFPKYNYCDYIYVDDPALSSSKYNKVNQK